MEEVNNEKCFVRAPFEALHGNGECGRDTGFDTAGLVSVRHAGFALLDVGTPFLGRLIA